MDRMMIRVHLRSSRRTRRAVPSLFCVLALSILTLPAWGDVPPAAPPAPATTQSSPDLRTELLALEGKLGELQDLTTTFTQQKFTPLLRKPLTSTGTIRVKGNLMRWDTDKPAPSSMLIAETEIRIYYPPQKVMEIYPIEAQLARLAASPVPRISIMQEHFAFERAHNADPAVLVVKLMPREETLKQHLDHVKLVIDRNSAYLREMEMVDGDGDRTVIRFDAVRLNTDLRPENLQIQVPEGTRISRPLAGQDGP